MNENIIPLPPFKHNVPEDDDLIPAICVAPCPRCTACVGWSEPTIICPSCGSEWELTPTQADEFTLALLGITDLRLDLFLQALEREDGTTPPPFAYPALLPTWHVTARFPSHVLAEVA